MSVKKYLMHADDIVLIDEVIEFKQGSIVSLTYIKPSTAFLENGELAIHKSIEMIAQTLGVYQGKLAELAGKKPRLGFLLGCRKFHIYVSSLKIGDKVQIVAKESLQDEAGFGVYDCELFANDKLGVKASLNVFSPDEKEVKRMLSE